MKAKIVTGHGAVIHYEARTPKIRVLPAAITTPRRGVDYWTEADQQAIAAEAQSAAEAAAEATAATMLSDPEYKESIKGDPGYTPVKGVDYFDGQDGAPGKDGQDGQPGRDGQDGAPGQDGQDGVSPTITVTDITGGHRVTITDADGAHSFDVVDGDAADAPVQDVQVNGTSILDAQGVANVPIASSSACGVFKTGSTTGTGLYLNPTSGMLFTSPASTGELKAGTNNNRPVVSSNEHSAAFYGLAKAAGDATQSASSNAVGNYTDNAKSAIHEMLNGSVAVTGTTPSITALPGIRYVCGECATLDITLSASGCVDVVFESGSTPTVLTITPPTGVTVKWANEFDPTALEADTTYEINIMDGLGVAASWT